MSKFKIGDKVVPCYDEEYGGYHNYLVESEVYTVTSVQYGLIDIDGVMTPLAVGYGESCKFDWSEDWFKLADEQLLSNAFDNAVEEVGETFLANSLIERESEMNAEQIRDEILRIDLRIEEAKKDIESAEKERNSLVEKLRERGFELTHNDSENDIHEEMNFKIGDQVRVIGKTHGHYFSIGEIVKVTEVNPHDYQCTGSNGQYWWLNPAEIEKI